MDNLFRFVLFPAVLGGDSSNIDSAGLSTVLLLPDAVVRRESHGVSVLKSVSSSPEDVKPRWYSELATVEDRSKVRACDAPECTLRVAVELARLSGLPRLVGDVDLSWDRSI